MERGRRDGERYQPPPAEMGKAALAPLAPPSLVDPLPLSPPSTCIALPLELAAALSAARLPAGLPPGSCAKNDRFLRAPGRPLPRPPSYGSTTCGDRFADWPRRAEKLEASASLKVVPGV